MKSQGPYIRKTGNNSGSTMTEVMVGFFMLLIVMGGMLWVFQITRASIIRADDIRMQYRELTAACYLDPSKASRPDPAAARYVDPAEGGMDKVEKTKEHVILKFQNIQDGAVFEIAAERETFQIPEGRALFHVVPRESEAVK